MDVFVTREGDRFTWDSEKAAANLAKHGVSFDRALDVFFDPLHEVKDASVPAENRLAVVGRDRRFRVLYVVHIEIEHETTRVISARVTTPSERRDYEELE